jgi:succinate dehydrogenase/fumarate reductase flavoprotein subunit
VKAPTSKVEHLGHGPLDSLSVPVQKWCISLEFKAGNGFKPEEYWSYFEDLNPLPNAEIE